MGDLHIKVNVEHGHFKGGEIINPKLLKELEESGEFEKFSPLKDRYVKRLEVVFFDE